MLDARNVEEVFRNRVQAMSLILDALTPKQAVEAMLSFYRNERADACSFDKDGDMLLFQWGTYNWGKGEHVAFNLTRQFIPDDQKGEDDNIWQLYLNLEYEPLPEFRILGKGNKWCHRPEEIDAFREYIVQSPPYVALGDLRPQHVELRFFRAG